MRPPRALDRLTETPGGQRLSPRRRPWSDGSTALRLDPVERLARLAALVPALRRPWLVSHAVRAPPAAWRAARVPGDPAPPHAPGRWSWARLLRRAFAIDLLVCPRGAGPRRILGAMTEPHAVQRRLGVLGWPLSRRPASLSAPTRDRLRTASAALVSRPPLPSLHPAGAGAQLAPHPPGRHGTGRAGRPDPAPSR